MDEEFVALVTAAAAQPAGAVHYNWAAQGSDGQSGDYETWDGARDGSPSDSPMVELNNQTIALPALVRARLRGGLGEDLLYEFEAAGTGGGGGSLTVEELDGSPSGTASKIQTDGATGLRVQSVTGGTALLKNDAAALGAWGVVTTGAQTMAGVKSFQGTVSG